MNKVNEASPASKTSDVERVVMRENLEHVGWQQRYIDTEEGASMWQFCDDRSAQILKGRPDYELRPVYA